MKISLRTEFRKYKKHTIVKNMQALVGYYIIQIGTFLII